MTHPSIAELGAGATLVFGVFLLVGGFVIGLINGHHDRSDIRVITAVGFYFVGLFVTTAGGIWFIHQRDAPFQTPYIGDLPLSERRMTPSGAGLTP